MVRVIVFALIALGWWLAAPDRFTAAARTATGTGLKAAGTGAKAHWNGGRDGRKAVRTDRRDRWHKRGGWWRKLLGLEHGAVVTGKAVRGAGKLAGAAVKPVPGAVREGWRKGQDRHRARTVGRPMPVALDPPWWRKPDPAPVPGETGEDSPQDSGPASEGGPTGQPAERPAAATVLGEKGAHCSRCLSPVGRYWAECPTCQAALAGLMTASGKYLPSADTAVERIPPVGRIPTDPEDLGGLIRQIPTGRDEYGEPYIDDVILLDRLNQQEGGAAAGIWSRAVAAAGTPITVWKSSAECGGCGADADYTTVTACPNCGAGFTSIQSVYPEYADAIRRERPDLPVTTTPEGDPMFENEANYSQAGKMRRGQARHRSPASPGTSGATPTELRTHVAVQDFAQQIDRISEASDFVVVAEQAREVGAKSRAGGFGAEMDSAVDELESVAKRFAQDVDSLRAQAHHLTKTSLSVQGS